MLPFIHIFGRTIAMYGLLIATGLVLGISLLVYRSKKYLIPREDALFTSLFACIGLFIGAKLLYLILEAPDIIRHLDVFIQKPELLLSLLRGGYIFYGGLIGALSGIYIYCRKYKLSTLRMLDLAAPSIPLIHGFGRLGCFFAGCCYGIHYTGPGNVIFKHSIAAPKDIPLLPVQLIESGINFMAAILLLAYAKPSRKPGRTMGIYIIYYALLRFIMEFFRGDGVRGFLFGVSTSQWISLFLLPVGIWSYTGIKSIVIPFIKTNK